jgi:Fur family transcriptional regulator, ferric uptake regulator
MAGPGSDSAPIAGDAPPDLVESAVWSRIRDELRARGHRWTPQRRLILEVLESTDGHVTGSDLVERCRARDPDTTPSTVYRTLDVLEELGYLRHSHSAAGREEFHVLPAAEHGHLQCRGCGRTWELDPVDAAAVVDPIRSRFGFAPDVGHLTISGLCAECTRSSSGRAGA